MHNTVRSQPTQRCSEIAYTSPRLTDIIILYFIMLKLKNRQTRSV